MMESTRCRYSVVSFLSRSDHNRETTTTNGRDLTTTRPACAPSITRPWIMECEKKLLKIRSEHWNLGEWCVMVHRLSFENILLPREMAWDLCLRHALLSFKLPLENLSVDCQQPGELVPTGISLQSLKSVKSVIRLVAIGNLPCCLPAWQAWQQSCQLVVGSSL